MNLLDLRERRYQLILDRVNKLKKSQCVIKANYPGPKKENIYSSYSVISAFRYMKKKIDIADIFFELDDEGFIAIFSFEKDAGEVKKIAIDYEKKSPLGPLVDIDIYGKDGKEISRQDLNLPQRTCFLCQAPAKECSRSRKHKQDQIENFYIETVLAYILSPTSSLKFVDFVLTNELMRRASLGTVTSLKSGCHKDMDFFTFLDSSEVLSHEFKKLKNLNDRSFLSLRKLGLEIEKNMFKVTKGANTHKGIIFSFLIILNALAFTDDFYSLTDVIKNYSKTLEKDFSNLLNEKTLMLYNKYGIRGARGQALDGYKEVFDDYLAFFVKEKDLTKLFLYIASKTDDTNLINRTSYQEALTFKKYIRERDLAFLEGFALEKNISLGGSCDLVAISLLIFLIKNNYKRIKEEVIGHGN